MILSRNRKFPPARQCARELFLRKIEYFSSRIWGQGGRGLEGKTIDEGCFSPRTGGGKLNYATDSRASRSREKIGFEDEEISIEYPGPPTVAIHLEGGSVKRKQRFFRRNHRKSRRGNSVRMGKKSSKVETSLLFGQLSVKELKKGGKGQRKDDGSSA